MARFNEILSGRFNRFMQKHFSMKGGPPAPQLASELTMNMQFLNGVENRYLESWDRYSMVFSRSGVAAQVGKGQLRNPVGSNLIAVVEKITWVGGAVDQPVLWKGNVNNDLAVVTNAGSGNFDNRSRPLSSLILSQETSVPGIPVGTIGIWSGVNQANVTVDVLQLDDQEIPMLPGSVLGIEGQVVAQSFNAVFWWRERFLEDSERT
jgi:hypothetical protein